MNKEWEKEENDLGWIKLRIKKIKAKIKEYKINIYLYIYII